ncbi:DUF4440 domain-containing protein [Paenalcaligenes sp. Me131]|uniref:nuclear transport factor 2 family protein n=1 Tax=Paenalcaligenes sp. Me131 TaxID=3392636 RepID=UPI003D29010B
MNNDLNLVMRLERELLLPATRANQQRINALLCDDFQEVGATGQSFGKETVIDTLPAESETMFSVHEMRAQKISNEVILVTYRLEKRHAETTTHSIRSSLWLRGPNSWQMRYHQGTLTR